MAKRPRPDPVLAGLWKERLQATKAELDQQRKVVKDLEDKLSGQVRDAFAEGVTVSIIMDATGYSGSRIYQFKFALRDAE